SAWWWSCSSTRTSRTRRQPTPVWPASSRPRVTTPTSRPELKPTPRPPSPKHPPNARVTGLIFRGARDRIVLSELRRADGAGRHHRGDRRRHEQPRADRRRDDRLTRLWSGGRAVGRSGEPGLQAGLDIVPRPGVGVPHGRTRRAPVHPGCPGPWPDPLTVPRRAAPLDRPAHRGQPRCVRRRLRRRCAFPVPVIAWWPQESTRLAGSPGWVPSCVSLLMIPPYATPAT